MTQLDQIEALLTACHPAPVASGHVGTIAGVRGPVLKVRNFPYAVGTGAAVGDAAIAETIGFDGDEALLALLSGASPRPGTAVRRCTATAMTSVGDALVGRILNALGLPVDGLGPLWCSERRETAMGRGSARGPVRQVFETGVRAIDALLTLGHGQRIILAAGSGVGKSTLIHQVIAGAGVDICVVALVGERNREIADFADALRRTGGRLRTIAIAEAADHSPLLRIRAAQRATTIAEYFRDQGKRVLLVVDSLTRVAHAQRELGLALGETPTMKGYPSSALSIIPALLERCGGDARTGGSITALYTVLADGDDMDDPVVDTARASADGHVVLSRTLAEQGVFPAIDIGRSLSRVMPDLVTAEHAAGAMRWRRYWGLAEENRDLALMGALRGGVDPEVDFALAVRPALLDFVRQERDTRMPFEASVARLTEAFDA